MNRTIKFDNCLAVVTIEIRHIIPDLMLTSKFQANELSVSNQFPEQVFRWRLFFAQFSCSLNKTTEIISSPIIALTPLYLWERGWG